MILPLTSQSYPRNFSEVATMLMGISVFQLAEEELMKLTTNSQQQTANNNNYNQENRSNYEN